MSTAGGNTTRIIDPERAAESNSAIFLAVVCAVWSLALVTALVRFYTRAVLVRSFGKDDVFMVFSVLCGIGGIVLWVVLCRHGYGRHQDTISPSDFLRLLEAQFFHSIIEATFAFGFLKISIALSLLRLGTRGVWYNRILWTLIGFTCFYTLFAFITFLTYCKPIAGLWSPSLRPKCYNRVIYRNFGLFNAACNMFTDICFATLPVPLIWSLQLQRRVRVYLIAILSGGYFAVALGIARAIFIIAYVRETDGTFFPWPPFFGSLQLDIGILAACAPTLRPLLGRALRLPTTLDPHRGAANYYRAGKALSRLPATTIATATGSGPDGCEPDSSGSGSGSGNSNGNGGGGGGRLGRNGSGRGRYHHRARPESEAGSGWLVGLVVYLRDRAGRRWGNHTGVDAAAAAAAAAATAVGADDASLDLEKGGGEGGHGGGGVVVHAEHVGDGLEGVGAVDAESKGSASEDAILPIGCDEVGEGGRPGGWGSEVGV